MHFTLFPFLLIRIRLIASQILSFLLQSVPNLFPSTSSSVTGPDHHLNLQHHQSDLQQHLRRLEEVANETSGLPAFEPHLVPSLTNLTGLTSSGYLPAIAASELVNSSTDYDLMSHGDMEQLSLEIEKERYFKLL